MGKKRKRLITRDTEQWLFYNIGVPFIWGLLRMLARTWKVKRINPERAHDRPAIYAIYHGDLVVGAQELPDFGTRLEVLTSRSRDGWMVTRYVHMFKRSTIRGGSSKGAESALRQMARRLKQGYGVIIPVDGPRGPEGEPKIGVIAIAAMSGAPIIPCAVRSNSVWRFSRSWDRMMVAKPFAKVDMHWGEPQHIPEGADRDTMEAERMKLQETLREMHIGTK
jgi:lysophospholipid acyltransferase (LPLAT)-like uncharacterized protein